MTHRERVKKNKPQRTQPMRQWPNIFRHPDQSSTTGKRSSKSHTMGSTKDNNNSGSQQQGDDGCPLDPTKIFDTFSNLNGWSAAANAAGDIAEQSVRQGYNVIEDQIRRGREAAEQTATRFTSDDGPGANPFNDYRNYFESLTGQSGTRTGSPADGFGASPEFNALVTRLAQSTAELSTACLQFSNSMLSNPQLLNSLASLWQQPGAAPSGPGTGNHQSPHSGDTPDTDQDNRQGTNRAAGLGIEVISTYPVKARLQLFADAVFNEPTSHGLHSSNSKAPPLRQISFSTDSAGSNVVQITIPDDQPGGTYSGVLMDIETNQTCGTITVEITRPKKPATPARSKKPTTAAVSKKKRKRSN